MTLFLPRAGLAYRLNDKTAVRVGYSRFAVTWLSNSSDDSIIYANGFSQSTSALGPLSGIPRSYLADPVPVRRHLSQPGHSGGRDRSGALPGSRQ